jgi:hypothetical protein
MITWADVNDAMAAAGLLVEAEDYAGARREAIKAQGYLAALPSSSRGDARMEWNAEMIAGFIQNLEKLARASSQAANGIVREKVEFCNPS